MHLGSVAIDSNIYDLSNACIPITDRGFLFGHALFETILLQNGNLVFWDEHWRRLVSGAKESRINMISESDLLATVQLVVLDNIKKSGCVSAKMQIKIIVTGGSSLLLWDSNTNDNPPRVVIISRNIPGLPSATYEKGITLSLAPDRRNLNTVGIKGTGYLPNMLALAEAQEFGNDDALFYNQNNEITESTTAGFLWLNEKRELCTTSPEFRCLPSTTLLGLTRALSKIDIKVIENIITVDQLSTMKLGFIISATRGVVPVRSIDKHNYDVSSELKLTAQLNNELLKEQQISYKQLK